MTNEQTEILLREILAQLKEANQHLKKNENYSFGH